MPSDSNIRPEDALTAGLKQLESQGLRRALRIVDSAQSPRLTVPPRDVLNFSSNDYLGLAAHPALVQAAVHTAERFGVGSGASRLICGSLRPHHALEEALASFKGTEAALTFNSGYAAALGAITAVIGKDDVVILDRLAHACIVDAARLAGAKLRVFRHNDLNDLERMLKWARSRSDAASAPRRILIVTESVFSMDGDIAPLSDIAALKEAYGAWLMVDEAHATGLFGTRGSGLVEEFGLAGRVEIQMATLGKALGSSGGAICGSRALIDWLINRARSFIYTTAPAPMAAAAATAAVQLVQSGEGRGLRDRLWALVEHFKTGMIQHGWPPPPLRSAIIPWMLGEDRLAVSWAGRLLDRNILVPAIRQPTVPKGTARLRFTLSASHAPEDINRLVDAMNGIRGLDERDSSHA